MKPGIHKHRLDPRQNNPDEVRFATEWEKETERGLFSMLLTPFEPDAGRDGYGVIRNQVIPSERDEEVAATVIQWLGTNVGRGFLLRVIEKSAWFSCERSRASPPVPQQALPAVAVDEREARRDEAEALLFRVSSDIGPEETSGPVTNVISFGCVDDVRKWRERFDARKGTP